MEKVKRTFGFIFNHPLGKKHLVKALSRFIYWQLQSSLSPTKYIVKTLVQPVKFYARKGLTGITGNIYTGLHEFNDMAFLLHFLRNDDVFIDIGANVGSYSLLASGVCRANSIAIEPVKYTADLLKRNINLNNLQNKVTIVNACAGAEAGLVFFTKNEDTTNHVIAAGEVQTEIVEVAVVKVDSLTEENIPALVKIDAEGYETEVLKGMQQTLEQSTLKAIIIELNGSGGRYGYDETKIHENFISLGFLPYQYDPFNRQLSPINTYGNHNTIYCRDIDFVNKRIKFARAIKVMGEKL